MALLGGDARAIQSVLQRDHSPSLKRRRALVGLGAAGLVDAAAMALRQAGVVHELPDLPLPGFDSNRVVAPRAAYALGVPDAPIAALNYATTMILATLVDQPRRRRSGWWSIVLGASVGMGALGAIAYGLDMLLVERRACMYCIPALALNLAMLPLALPELREGIRRLRRR